MICIPEFVKVMGIVLSVLVSVVLLVLIGAALWARDIERRGKDGL